MTSSSWFAPLNGSDGPPVPPLGGELDAWRPPRIDPAPGDGDDEVAAFVQARLEDTREALLARHRARCGTSSNQFGLDQYGNRFQAPPCLCDRNISRAYGELNVQQQIVAAALHSDDSDRLGSRVLRLLATSHSDHSDYRRAWNE